MRNALILFILLTILVSCESKYKTDPENYYKPTPQELEKNNPKRYIILQSTDQTTNFWGTKSEFKIKIKNIAKYAIYKDLELRIQLLSKTESIVQQYKKVIYDYFEPNHSYDLEFDLPPLSDDVKAYKIIVYDVKFAKYLRQ